MLDVCAVCIARHQSHWRLRELCAQHIISSSRLCRIVSFVFCFCALFLFRASLQIELVFMWSKESFILKKKKSILHNCHSCPIFKFHQYLSRHQLNHFLLDWNARCFEIVWAILTRLNNKKNVNFGQHYMPSKSNERHKIKFNFIVTYISMFLFR